MLGNPLTIAVVYPWLILVLSHLPMVSLLLLIRVHGCWSVSYPLSMVEPLRPGNWWSEAMVFWGLPGTYHIGSSYACLLSLYVTENPNCTAKKGSLESQLTINLHDWQASTIREILWKLDLIDIKNGNRHDLWKQNKGKTSRSIK